MWRFGEWGGEKGTYILMRLLLPPLGDPFVKGHVIRAGEDVVLLDLLPAQLDDRRGAVHGWGDDEEEVAGAVFVELVDGVEVGV